MANTTNFGWETPDDTDLVKDGAAAMRTLGNAIDTSLVDLKGGTTGQVLSKASNTDMDFTWVEQDDSNAIQNAIVDAKGDLIAASAADTPARLAVGTNNQVLMADSAQSTGLKYANEATATLTTTGDILYASAANTLARRGIGSTGDVLTVSGGVPTWAAPATGGGMTLIQQYVANADSSISFSSISSSYKQLLLMWGDVQHSGSGSQFRLRINNDSGSNYNWCSMTYSAAAGSNGNVGTNISVDAAFGEQTYNTNLYQVNFGFFLLDNYASSTKAKTYNYSFGYRNAVNGNNCREIGNGVWNSTSAVTSLDIVRTVGTATISNMTNTTIRLYGVA